MAPSRTKVWERDRLGRSLMVVGVFGGIATLLATAVAWRLAGHLEGAVDDSLSVASDTLVIVDDGLRLAHDVVGDIGLVVAPAGDAVASTSAGVRDVGQVLSATAGVTRNLPAQLDAVGSATTTLGAATAALDDLLSRIGLGGIPGAGELPAAAADLQQRLAVLRSDLTGLSAQLDATVREGADLAVALDELAAALSRTDQRLDEAFTLLDRSRTSVARARAVATTTQDDLERELRVLRFLVVLLGLTITAGHVLVYQFGRQVRFQARLGGLPGSPMTPAAP